MHEQNSFITLTYDQDHLPESRSLDVKHWQLFAKRLRKSHGKFRFYHCGEYGEVTSRPHYHAVIFGLDFSHDRKLLKLTKDGHPLYTSPSLDKAWGKGYCNIGEMTMESAAYVARYCMKKVTGKIAEHYYERIDPETGEVFNLKPPYTTMSRKPGIGGTWFEKYEPDVYPRDEVIINAQKSRPPSYYDRQLDKSDPDLLQQIKKQREKDAELFTRDNTPKRLAVKESIIMKRINKLKRRSIL